MSAPIDIDEGRKAKLQAFFPTPVWTFEWEWGDQLSAMATEVRRQMATDPEGMPRSNRGGWHSKGGILKAEVFAPLAKRIEEEIHRINPDLKLGGGWANVNFPGSYNLRHAHPESVLSGTFYLEVPENSGDLTLEDPREVAHMVGGLPKALNAPVRIEPKEGMLVLFPAWVPHFVAENESDRDRISIAFNAAKHLNP